MPCPICSHEALEPSFRVAFPSYGAGNRVAWDLKATPDVPHWIISRCPACGVQTPDPRPTAADIIRFYADQAQPSSWEVEHYVDVRPDQAAGWHAFAERLTRLAGGPGRLLEVGCAAGHLLSAAIHCGWDVMGVEPAPKFSDAAKRRGLPVHAGTLATMPAQKPFDMIVMIDVLEHLVDPVAELALCRQLLGPEGLVVVATCDIGSLAARHYGLKWRQIVISHTFYWTQDSLRIALDRSGFEPIGMSSMRYWDPDPALQRRRRAREMVKLLFRKTLLWTWMPLAKRVRQLRTAQSRLTRGRFDFDWLESKVGDQAVAADVALVVGRVR